MCAEASVVPGLLFSVIYDTFSEGYALNGTHREVIPHESFAP